MYDQGFTDIHMHVIPGVDDGADSIDTAMEMLVSANKQGVTHVIATPHSAAFDGFRSPVKGKYSLLLDCIQKCGIGIDLSIGAEVFVEKDEISAVLKKLNSGKYPTMNGRDYVLVEFPLFEKQIDEAAYCINRLTDKGYNPILAHAERYSFEIDQLYELKEMGCMLQVNFQNLGPANGYSSREKANTMLLDEMIDFVATDAHNMANRNPDISEALIYINEHTREMYYRKLLYDNPALIMDKTERGKEG